VPELVGVGPSQAGLEAQHPGESRVSCGVTIRIEESFARAPRASGPEGSDFVPWCFRLALQSALLRLLCSIFRKLPAGARSQESLTPVDLLGSGGILRKRRRECSKRRSSSGQRGATRGPHLRATNRGNQLPRRDIEMRRFAGCAPCCMKRPKSFDAHGSMRPPCRKRTRTACMKTNAVRFAGGSSSPRAP
jgi:hypothetical protein